MCWWIYFCCACRHKPNFRRRQLHRETERSCWSGLEDYRGSAQSSLQEWRYFECPNDLEKWTPSSDSHFWICVAAMLKLFGILFRDRIPKRRSVVSESSLEESPWEGGVALRMERVPVFVEWKV